MLEKHHTRDGDTMLIAQMTDEHLTNYIKLVCRQVIGRQRMAEVIDTSNDYQRRLYDVPKVDDKEAARQNRVALTNLCPYLAEAYVRGLETPREDIVQALGRKTSIQDASAVYLPDNIDAILS